MEPIKTTNNLEFDLIYSDGEKKHIRKGILFEETDEGTLNIHIGTDNQFNMLLAMVAAITDILDSVPGIRAEFILKKKEENNVPEH